MICPCVLLVTQSLLSSVMSSGQERVRIKLSIAFCSFTSMDSWPLRGLEWSHLTFYGWGKGSPEKNQSSIWLVADLGLVPSLLDVEFSVSNLISSCWRRIFWGNILSRRGFHLDDSLWGQHIKFSGPQFALHTDHPVRFSSCTRRVNEGAESVAPFPSIHMEGMCVKESNLNV